MRPDDAFWAARIVARFSDEMIGGIVKKAQYSDPKATEYLTKVLIARRDKVLATWLNQVCPVVDPVLGADGALTFKNAAVAARAATEPEGYQLQWFRFDNATNTRTPAGDPQAVMVRLKADSTGGRAESAAEARAPGGLLDSGEYVGVTVTGRHPQHAGWMQPATFFFRRGGSGWTLVGVERGS